MIIFIIIIGAPLDRKVLLSTFCEISATRPPARLLPRSELRVSGLRPHQHDWLLVVRGEGLKQKGVAAEDGAEPLVHQRLQLRHQRVRPGGGGDPRLEATGGRGPGPQGGR